MNINRADSTILWRVLAAAVVTLTFTGATGVLSRSAAADPTSNQQVFVRLINQTRTDLSLPPLTVHPELTSAAAAWTSTMVDNGQVTHSSNLAAGISEAWSLLGENVGVHSIDDPDELFRAFVNSPSHYANIVDPRFLYVGVGVMHGPDGKLWTTHRFMAAHQSPTTTTPPTPTTATSPSTSPPTSPSTSPSASPPTPPASSPSIAPSTSPAPPPSTSTVPRPTTTVSPTTVTTARPTTRPTAPPTSAPDATTPTTTTKRLRPAPAPTVPRTTIPRTTAPATTPPQITAQSAVARRATAPWPLEQGDLTSDLDDQQLAELVQPDASTIETVLIDLLTAGI